MLLVVICGCRKEILKQRYNNYPTSRRYTGLKGHTRIGSKLEIKEEIFSDHGDNDKRKNTICKINNEHGNWFEQEIKKDHEINIDMAIPLFRDVLETLNTFLRETVPMTKYTKQ